MEKRDYHGLQGRCKSLDDYIELKVAKSARDRLLHYYDISGIELWSRSLLTRLVRDSEINTVSKFALLKMEKEDIHHIPRFYDALPKLMDADFFESKKDAKKWIQNCIHDRTEFRTLCVKGCNRGLIDEGHDDYVLKLQILYAKLAKACKR